MTDTTTTTTTVRGIRMERELDEPARIVLTLTHAPEEDPGEPLTVDLEDLGGRTRMVVVQRGNELTDEQYAQAQVGWMHFFDVMAELLVTPAAKPQPAGEKKSSPKKVRRICGSSVVRA